jgi:hypothetical protein
VAVYVIVIVVLVVLLIAAYRSLGGSRPRAIDSGRLALSLHAQLDGSLAGLTTWLQSQPPAASDDAARAGRRLTAGIQQTLDRLPGGAQLGEADLAARALLAAAAEDAAWAWRIVQADGISPGLTAAVAALRDHAAACCTEAARLLPAAASGEPRESAGDPVL